MKQALTALFPLFFATSAFAQQAPSVTSFAPVVEKVAPSVVTVYSTKVVRNDRSGNPLYNNPQLRRYFGIPDPEDMPDQKQQGLGSGVVVSSDGFILTNNHVIEDADEIMVSFGTENKEFKAKKIGTDPRTDIAVLKIEAKDLPALEFADSSKVRVGDLVLALGNPLGLRQSVSMGIVSAMDRGGLGITDYENFIQTDAAINQGNSGGALVDATGKLVGINTAIFTRSGGNQGIGFAVPSNLARDVMEKLRDKGRVARGYMGVSLQPLTQELAAQFKLKDDKGALIAEVVKGSPAATAKLKAGDVVTELDGKKVVDSRTLRLDIGARSPGTKVELGIVREGESKKFLVDLGELPGNEAQASVAPQSDDENPNALTGIAVGDIDASTRQRFNLSPNVQGVVVTAVEAGSPASGVIQPGDVIHEINREPVTTADEAIKLSKKIKSGEKVLLRVSTQSQSRFIVLEDKKE